MVPTLLEQREFRELYAKVDNQRISDSLAEKGLKWNREQGFQASELEIAQSKIWRLVQLELFSDELRCLAAGKPLPPKSPLIPLSPFLDAEGLLRAKGRLRKSADLCFNSKHPLVLSSSHPAVKLFLESKHRELHHQGVEFIRSMVQQDLWILKLRSSFKAIKNNCVPCKNVRTKNFEPEMADLPVKRLGSSRAPFSSVGVDFFGPFEVKICRKSFKRWCCLFTCLTSRAVHIEVCQESGHGVLPVGDSAICSKTGTT